MSETTPINHGGPWTTEEDDRLLKELATTMDIEDIATKHRRTPGAICARQNHIARRMVLQEGRTVEDAARLVRKSPSAIQQSLNASQVSNTNAQQRRDAGMRKDESLLSVMVEVRELLKQMVANQMKLMETID